MVVAPLRSRYIHMGSVDAPGLSITGAVTTARQAVPLKGGHAAAGREEGERERER